MTQDIELYYKNVMIMEEIRLLRRKLYNTLCVHECEIPHPVWTLLNNIDNGFVAALVAFDDETGYSKQHKANAAGHTTEWIDKIVFNHIKNLLEEGYNREEIAIMTDHTVEWVDEVLGIDNI